MNIKVCILLISVTFNKMRADELVQPLEIGNTVIVIGVPVLDSRQKVVTLEACHFTEVVEFCQI